MRCEGDTVLTVVEISLQPAEIVAHVEHSDRMKTRTFHHLLVLVGRRGGFLDTIRSPLASAIRAGDHVEVEIAVEEMLPAHDEAYVAVKIDTATRK